MSKTYITSVSSVQTKYPKKLLLWNYWDHEHIVGTHFEYYKKVKKLVIEYKSNLILFTIDSKNQ